MKNTNETMLATDTAAAAAEPYPSAIGTTASR